MTEKSSAIKAFFNELSEKVTAFDPAPAEETYFTLDSLRSYKDAAEKDKETIKTELEKSGICRYGRLSHARRIKYNPETAAFESHNNRIAVMTVRKVNGKIRAQIKFDKQLTAVSTKGSYRRYLFNHKSGFDLDFPVSEMPGMMHYSRFTLYDQNGSTEEVKLTDENIYITKDSIESFYTVGERTYEKLSKPAVDYFYESGSRLEKNYVNKTGSQNCFGLTSVIWHNPISDINSDYELLDDDVEEEDYEAITRGRNSLIALKIIDRYNLIRNKRENSKEQKKAKLLELAEYIKEIENRLEEHKDDIISFLCRKYNLPEICPESMEKSEWQKKVIGKIDSAQGFDCGWLYFEFVDEDKRKLTEEAGLYAEEFTNEEHIVSAFRDGTFWINFPFYAQSTTLLRTMFEYVRTNFSMPYNVNYRVQLD